MPRKLRLVYENAVYHVVNRGNYRSDVFETSGAALAFEEVMFEAGPEKGVRAMFVSFSLCWCKNVATKGGWRGN